MTGDAMRTCGPTISWIASFSRSHSRVWTLSRSAAVSRGSNSTSTSTFQTTSGASSAVDHKGVEPVRSNVALLLVTIACIMFTFSVVYCTAEVQGPHDAQPGNGEVPPKQARMQTYHHARRLAGDRLDGTAAARRRQ
jgi:hypothetical protein